MTRVAIFTTAVGYQPQQIAPLWRSLERTGFKGQLIMLVDDQTADALESHVPRFVRLLAYEKHLPETLLKVAPAAIRQLLEQNSDPLASSFMTDALKIDYQWTIHYIATFNHPSVFRYLFYLDYLSQIENDVDAVILCDARDIIFQVNPEVILKPDMKLHFGIEQTNNRLGVEPFNTAWIQYLYGDQAVARYNNNRISCSGATIGSVAPMLDYLVKLCGEIVTQAGRMTNGYGFDQGIHNTLWWDKKIPDLQMTENFFADVVNLFGEPVDRVNAQSVDGVVRREDTNEPIMLVHQYDRYSELAGKLLKDLI